MPPRRSSKWFSENSLFSHRLCNLKYVDNRGVVFVWIILKSWSSFTLNAAEKLAVTDTCSTLYDNIICDTESSVANGSGCGRTRSGCSFGFENIPGAKQYTRRRGEESITFSNNNYMNRMQPFDKNNRAKSKPEFVINPVNLFSLAGQQVGHQHQYNIPVLNTWHDQNHVFHPNMTLYRSFSDTAVVQQTCSNVHFHRNGRYTQDTGNQGGSLQGTFKARAGKSKCKCKFFCRHRHDKK